MPQRRRGRWQWGWRQWWRWCQVRRDWEAATAAAAAAAVVAVMWWPVAASTIKLMPMSAIEPTMMVTTKQMAAIRIVFTLNAVSYTASVCALP